MANHDIDIMEKPFSPPELVQRISALIANDMTWAQKYAELTAFHQSISSGLEMEQPSLRFSKNVMETIETVQFAPSVRRLINVRIVRGIAAFFILIT